MSTLKSYRDLEVWKKSIDLVEWIYRASKNFPPEERFGLTSQIRRAAVSVPSNIAEGAARTGTGEFLQSLSVASGSLAEVETQLLIATRLEMITAIEREALLAQTEEISKMLSGLKRSLASKVLTPSDFPLSLTTGHYSQVTVHGVDVFDPSTGEVRSDSAENIACWFLDTDYNGESFFVRHAYFLGQNDPYTSLENHPARPKSTPKPGPP
jgi:four helix bundle protein